MSADQDPSVVSAQFAELVRLIASLSKRNEELQRKVAEYERNERNRLLRVIDAALDRTELAE